MNDNNGSVRVVESSFPIIISKVSNHEFFRDQFLSAISKTIRYPAYGLGVSLFNTDYFLNVEYPRPYYQAIGPAVEQHNNHVAKVLNSSQLYVNTHPWFQQYAKGDWHTWHVHADCMFTNVYYIQLDGMSSKTTLDVMGNQVEVEVEEGEIMTIPSFVQHCSKPNLSDNIKTIIGFNSNYLDVRKQNEWYNG